MSGGEAWLIVQLTGDDRAAAPALFSVLAGAAGDATLARCAAVELLETGSPEAAVFIGRWPDSAALQAFWDNGAAAAFEQHVPGPGAGSFAVTAPAVPPEGDPADPTLPHGGNSEAVTTATPGLMLVQGVVTEPGAMGTYRDLIRPLLRANHGYYLVYSFAADVTVLAGSWAEHALIVSVWPATDNARAFWYSDTYQNQAIPARTGAGRFSVSLFEAQRAI